MRSLLSYSSPSLFCPVLSHSGLMSSRSASAPEMRRLGSPAEYDTVLLGASALLSPISCERQVTPGCGPGATWLREEIQPCCAEASFSLTPSMPCMTRRPCHSAAACVSLAQDPGTDPALLPCLVRLTCQSAMPVLFSSRVHAPGVGSECDLAADHGARLLCGSTPRTLAGSPGRSLVSGLEC